MDLSSSHHHSHQAQPPPSSLSYRSSNSHLQHNNNNNINHHPADYHYHPGAPSSTASSQQQYSDDPHDANHTPGGRFTEEWDASQRGSSIIDGPRGKQSKMSDTHNAAVASSSPAPGSHMQRTSSVRSFAPGDDQQLPGTPSRHNTLKKKSSTRHAGGSLRRIGSRRSMRGSVRSLALHSGSDPDEAHSAFHCPVPTSGNPTDVLASRFQTWRKVLKDLIAYFREIQNHYEHRSKSLVKLSNVANNISGPPGFLNSAGIDDALQFLRTYNKNAYNEAAKAKEIEEDVILALTGLRSDLQQKIKEIKNLSGDFKNAVDKEMDNTSKSVRALSDALDKNEADASTTTGKQDPFLLRLAVDRQVERQIDEENYLHQAYLNLESSGRELESIVVGEIQKAYNAYAGILKREADNAYNVVEELRDGPVSMPKDQEWIHFVTHDDQFVDPTIPLRSAEQIHYPGQDHLSAQEIRAGLLERKSKYLKSYTAGWYVLSTTHLHEFKSADKAQAPIMSLYLPDQKLGSRSEEGGSSNKFILKGRQTGTMHRGHTWVFRAETHDTMMAWYEDIKALTEKTPEERSQFVRTHSRSLSRSSRRSVSSDGLEDEEDEEPFAAGSQIDVNPGPKQDAISRRSQPGGRFPSDLQVNAQRGLQAPHSPSSVSSGFQENNPDHKAAAAGAGVLGVGAGAAAAGAYSEDQDHHHLGYGDAVDRTPMAEMPSSAAVANREAQHDGVNPYTSEPVPHSQDSGAYVVPVLSAGHKNEDDQDKRAQEETAPLTSAPRDPSNMDATHHLNGGANANAMFVNAGGFPKSESTQENKAHSTLPDGPAVGGGAAVARPTSTNNRADSSTTISNLHIPGEFPRGSIAG